MSRNTTLKTPRRFPVRTENLLLFAVTLVLFLVLWEVLANLGWFNPFFTSSPSRIVKSAIWLFQHGFWQDILVSLVEFLLGMLLAILLSFVTGLLLGWYRRLNAMFEPFVTMMNAMPYVAILPLIILWFGIGIESKIVAVFLAAFFPLAINIMVGVKTVDPHLLACARSFGATDGQVFKTLVLPSSVPFFVAGLRIAVARGLVGIVVGEMMASVSGIGHMMTVANSTFQTDKLFVGIVLLASFGYLLVELIKRLEKRFNSWRG
jgi:ABC-type nitrate/sulfonate/bicarbonate transport system permease component